MEFTIGNVGSLGGECGQCWNLVGVLSYYIKGLGCCWKWLRRVLVCGRAVSENF